MSLFNCETVSLPMGTNCTSNTDLNYNYKCSYGGNWDCLNPSLWAIYSDPLEQ